MEHCLAPFLDLCDANKDRKISLYEWGGCLGLNQGTVYWCIGGSRISERGITGCWSWSSDSVVPWFRRRAYSKDKVPDLGIWKPLEMSKVLEDPKTAEFRQRQQIWSVLWHTGILTLDVRNRKRGRGDVRSVWWTRNIELDEYIRNRRERFWFVFLTKVNQFNSRVFTKVYFFNTSQLKIWYFFYFVNADRKANYR